MQWSKKQVWSIVFLTLRFSDATFYRRNKHDFKISWCQTCYLFQKCTVSLKDHTPVIFLVYGIAQRSFSCYFLCKRLAQRPFSCYLTCVRYRSKTVLLLSYLCTVSLKDYSPVILSVNGWLKERSPVIFRVHGIAQRLFSCYSLCKRLAQRTFSCYFPCARYRSKIILLLSYLCTVSLKEHSPVIFLVYGTTQGSSSSEQPRGCSILTHDGPGCNRPHNLSFLSLFFFVCNFFKGPMSLQCSFFVTDNIIFGDINNYTIQFFNDLFLEPNLYDRKFGVDLDAVTLANDYHTLKDLISSKPQFKDSGIYAPGVNNLDVFSSPRKFLAEYVT